MPTAPLRESTSIEWYEQRDSNPHDQRSRDFKSRASTIPPCSHIETSKIIESEIPPRCSDALYVLVIRYSRMYVKKFFSEKFGTDARI
jgi:hypothetical protein